MSLPSDTHPFKEAVKVFIAMVLTFGTFWLPLIILGVVTTKMFLRGDEGLSCAVAILMVLPALYLGALTSRKLGTWFCLNWGRPYIDVSKLEGRRD